MPTRAGTIIGPNDVQVSLEQDLSLHGHHDADGGRDTGHTGRGTQVAGDELAGSLAGDDGSDAGRETPSQIARRDPEHLIRTITAGIADVLAAVLLPADHAGRRRDDGGSRRRPVPTVPKIPGPFQDPFQDDDTLSVSSTLSLEPEQAATCRPGHDLGRAEDGFPESNEVPHGEVRSSAGLAPKPVGAIAIPDPSRRSHEAAPCHRQV